MCHIPFDLLRVYVLAMLAVVATASSALAQDGAVPPPYDTISVNVSEGLDRILAGSIEPTQINGHFYHGLIFRAGFLGTDADRPALREIARRFSGERTYGTGLVAMRALATLGGEESFFIEVAQRWDPTTLLAGTHPSRNPTFRMARAAVDYLAGNPTPRTLAVLDSLRKTEGQFGYAYSIALNNLNRIEEYVALTSDRERADEALRWAPVAFLNTLTDDVWVVDMTAHTSQMTLGRRWLRELSRSNPQAVAAAVQTAAAAQRAESLAWYLDGVEDPSAREREGARRRAERDELSYLRHVGALTSPEVRALIDPTGETWTRSPYERPDR